MSTEKPLISASQIVSSSLKKMDPDRLQVDEVRTRFESVFKVFVFKDDMVVQLEEKDGVTLIHIRSSSRVGYSDLGVNRRRVSTFLTLLRSAGIQIPE